MIKLANFEARPNRLTYDLVNEQVFFDPQFDFSLEVRRQRARAQLESRYGDRVFFYEDGVRFDVDPSCVNEEGFLIQDLSELSAMQALYMGITPVQRKASLQERFSQRERRDVPTKDGVVVEIVGGQEGAVELSMDHYRFLVLSFAGEDLNRDGVIVLRKGDWMFFFQADGVGRHKNSHLASAAALRAASAHVEQLGDLNEANLDQEITHSFESAKTAIKPLKASTTMSVVALNTSTGLSRTYHLSDHAAHRLGKNDEVQVLIRPQHQGMAELEAGARPDSIEVLSERHSTITLSHFGEEEGQLPITEAQMQEGDVAWFETDGSEGFVFEPFLQEDLSMGTGLFPAHTRLETLRGMRPQEGSLDAMGQFLGELDLSQTAHWDWSRDFSSVRSGVDVPIVVSKRDDYTAVVIQRSA